MPYTLRTHDDYNVLASEQNRKLVKHILALFVDMLEAIGGEKNSEGSRAAYGYKRDEERKISWDDDTLKSYIDTSLKKRMEDKGYVIFTYHDDENKVVAVASGNLQGSTYTLQNMVVDAEFRRNKNKEHQHFGTEFAGKIVEQLRAMGVETIEGTITQESESKGNAVFYKFAAEQNDVELKVTDLDKGMQFTATLPRKLGEKGKQAENNSPTFKVPAKDTSGTPKESKQRVEKE